MAVSAVTAMGAAGLAGAAQASSLPARAMTAAPTKVVRSYDFNGDGYPDLALGNPYGTVSGHAGAGFVTIVYGSSSGLNTAKKQVFSQNTTGVPGAAEAYDHFGFSVTSLDFDKDGYADLLIGAPDEDTTAGANAGSETILWGSPTGLTGTGSDAIAEPSPDAGAGHRFGYSLAAGDLDGDGYTDWVDTSPGDGYFWTFSSNPGTAPQVKTQGFHPTAKPHRVRGAGKVSTAATSALTALIPAIGDVNGDNKPDLVMAWQGTTAPKSGFDVWNFTPTDATVMGPDVYTRVDSLAVGDFDGDGYGDVAVGGADESNGTGGHVTVYKGDASVSLANPSTITQNSPSVPGTSVTGDRFGYAVSAGDVNKDGKYDLAVGVPYRAISSQSHAGTAIVLYGSASGLTGTGSQGISQNTSGVPGSAEKNDEFGWTVSMLNVNSDGWADLIVGAPLENGTDGAVSLLKGTATGVTGSGSVTVGSGTLGISGKDAQLGVRLGRSG